MRSVVLTAAAVVLLGSTGACIPEKRVVWSPDGQQAAVRMGDGRLFLCSPSGALSPCVAEHVTDLAWTHDARRLVLVRAIQAADWSTVRTLLPPERRAELERRTPVLLDEVLAYRGDWEQFKPAILAGLAPHEQAALLLSVRAQHADVLLAKRPDLQGKLAELQLPVYTLETAVVGADKRLEAGNVVLRQLAAMARPTPAPNDQAVAFVAQEGEDQTALVVAPLRAPSTPTVVEIGVGSTFAWTPDGKHLVYACTTDAAGGLEQALCAIKRRSVADDAGNVLAQLGDSEVLAVVTARSEPGLAMLPDGRALLTGTESAFPCVTPDMPNRSTFFLLTSGASPTCTRLVPKKREEAFPEDLSIFTVSPDGRHVAICDPQNGRLLVYTPATQDLWPLLSEEQTKQVRIWPTWRANDELTATVVRAARDNETTWDVALLRLDYEKHAVTRELLSAAWPNIETVDFLFERKGQPTTDKSEPGH